ncbi:hypothetical protein [Streptomyces virginiae]|uniref:hypothetical protein n=1 Tax=Streptomyces virginiae TaxID=1961 RepID=UPI0034481FFA
MTMYEFTAGPAAPDPPSGLGRLLAAVSRSGPAVDAFARVTAGVTSPAEFSAPGSAEQPLGQTHPTPARQRSYEAQDTSWPIVAA